MPFSPSNGHGESKIVVLRANTVSVDPDLAVAVKYNAKEDTKNKQLKVKGIRK